MASALSSSTAVLFLSTLLLLILFFISHNLTLNQTQLTIHSYSYSLTNISTNNNNNTTITSIPIPSTSHDIIQNIDHNSSTTTTPPNVSLASFLSPSSSLHPNTTNNNFQTAKKIIKSRSDKIEYDLAQARAAIHEAIVTKSFKSDKNESFIPRGSAYRNAYAFHQVVVAPMTRCRALNGIHGPTLAEYYTQRSTQGGFLIIEGTLVSNTTTAPAFIKAIYIAI